MAVTVHERVCPAGALRCTVGIVKRRTFLSIAGVAAASAAVASGYLLGETPAPAAPPMVDRGLHHPRMPLRNPPAPVTLPAHFFPPSLERVPAPFGTIYDLPGDRNLLALTVDDGGSSVCVAEYVRFCAETGLRLTFFLNGSLSSWTDNVSTLRPLVESGQIQLANHTWTHSSLPTLTDDGIRGDLLTNDEFIRTTYGVEARPYFRPPFGHLDDRVIAVAASIGYTTPVMWYGTFSDATEITDADLMASAAAYLLPDAIVIGHANYLTVTRHFGEIADIIRSRGLQPVTLDDVYTRP